MPVVAALVATAPVAAALLRAEETFDMETVMSSSLNDVILQADDADSMGGDFWSSDARLGDDLMVGYHQHWPHQVRRPLPVRVGAQPL